MGAIREAWEFGERWLGRAHLAYWLAGDGVVSSGGASMSGWLLREAGGSWTTVALIAVGAFVVVFAIVLFIAVLLRWACGRMLPTAYVPLHEAAAQLFGETRGTSIAEFAERSSKSPEEILDWYGYWMIQHDIRVYGKSPPSPILEEIPRIEIEGKLHFADGATKLMESYNKNPRFHDLAVRTADLRSHHKELIAGDGKP